MKKNWFYFLLALALVIFQLSLIPAVFSFRPLPNILYPLAIACVVVCGFRSAFFKIAAIGLLYDLLTYQRLGAELIGLMIMVYAVSFFSRRFLVESKIWGLFVIILFVIGGSFIQYLPELTLSFLLKDSVPRISFSFLLNSFHWQIILNLLVFAYLFFLVKKIENIKFLTASH